MFGVDFSEMMVIMVVALVVIGPERLPKVARTLGHLWGRAQRYVNGVKADISRDMAVEEFRQLQKKVQQEVSNAEQAVREVSQSVDHQVQELNSAVVQPAAAIMQPATTAASAPPEPVASAPQSAPSIPQPAPGIPQQAQLELEPPAEQKNLIRD
jgi:sec-independent protein translocase protein TatB